MTTDKPNSGTRVLPPEARGTAVENCKQCGGPLSLEGVDRICPKCRTRILCLPTCAESGEAPSKFISGAYELIEEIASGGMGTVYRARQIGLNRMVALKMIRSGTFATKAEVHRFHIEAEAAGNLDHPNIVPIYEIHEHEGQHFFSMKLVEGRSLADELQHQPIPPRRAAELMVKIAGALHHAHERGIMHCDLKPRNILLDPRGEPQVMDFGLAKLLQRAEAGTPPEGVMGTLNYMAPEQAFGRAKDLTTAADVYALGGVLYAMLTGRPPFHGSNASDLFRKLEDEKPCRPGLLNARVDGDLETICLKCLAKDPHQRYSAADLASELQRWLRHEPIYARHATIWHRGRKWLQRHPVLTVFALVAAITIGGFLGMMKINHGRVRHQYDRAEESLTQLRFERVEDLFRQGESAIALSYLAQILRRNPTNRMAAARIVSALAQRNFALPVTEPFVHNWSVIAAGFNPDGTRVVTASWDKIARIWDAQNGKLLATPLLHDDYVRWAEFSPDGRRILSAAEDHTVRIWDAETGRGLFTFRHDDKAWAAQWHPVGRLIASASWDHTARLWDAEEGKPFGNVLRHHGRVVALDFSRDGKKIVTASEDGTARIWYVYKDQALLASLRHTLPVNSVQFSPDSARVVTASENSKAQIWDAISGEPLALPLMHRGPVLCARFSPDGVRVVTASWDGTARIWNAATGDPICPPIEHDAQVGFADFSPDGKRVVTASWDKTARIWDGFSGMPLSQPLRHNGNVCRAQFSPNGQHLVTAAWDNRAQLWDVRPGNAAPLLLGHGNAVRFAQFSSNADRVVTAASDKTARVWNAQTGTLLAKLPHNEVVRWAEFSADRNRVVTASDDQGARIWDAASGKLLVGPLDHAAKVKSCQFSRTGQWIVTTSMDNIARLWDANSGELLHAFIHKGQVHSARFSHDARRIITAGADNRARIWDTQSGQLITDAPGHDALIDSAEFSPDGRWVVTASWDNTARVWDAHTGTALFEQPLKHNAQVLSAHFSPDGRFVVTASRDKTARIWETLTGHPVCKPLRHSKPVIEARFSPDTLQIVTASQDNSARVWDVQTGHPVTEPLEHSHFLTACEFSADGQRVLTASLDGTAKVWEVRVPTEPPPAWLAGLAEAMGGQQFNLSGVPEIVGPSELQKLRHAVLSSGTDSFYNSWVNWFFADRSTRARSAFSPAPPETK